MLLPHQYSARSPRSFPGPYTSEHLTFRQKVFHIGQQFDPNHSIVAPAVEPDADNSERASRHAKPSVVSLPDLPHLGTLSRRRQLPQDSRVWRVLTRSYRNP